MNGFDHIWDAFVVVEMGWPMVIKTYMWKHAFALCICHLRPIGTLSADHSWIAVNAIRMDIRRSSPILSLFFLPSLNIVPHLARISSNWNSKTKRFWCVHYWSNVMTIWCSLICVTSPTTKTTSAAAAAAAVPMMIACLFAGHLKVFDMSSIYY